MFLKFWICLGLSLLAALANAAPVNNIGKTTVTETGPNVSVQIQLLKSNLTDGEISVRSNSEFMQVEIPGLMTTQGQQLYPMGKELMKSVLVAPTADQKGTRIKYTFRQKGTVDPSYAEVALTATELKLTLPKKALQARLRTNEAVRTVLIGHSEAGRPIAEESVKLTVRGAETVAEAEEEVEVVPTQLPIKKSTAKAEAVAKEVKEKSEPESIAKLAEDQIPVKAEVTAATAGEKSQWPRLMATAGLLLIVLGTGAFFLLKYTKKQSILSQAPKMRILNQFHLGPKKQLMVVQIAGESMLLGVTDHNITFLKNLALLDEEMPAHVPADFKKALEVTSAEVNTPASMSDEEYEYQGLNEIRDRVSSRLSKMRTFS